MACGEATDITRFFCNTDVHPESTTQYYVSIVVMLKHLLVLVFASHLLAAPIPDCPIPEASDPTCGGKPFGITVRPQTRPM